MDSKRARQNKEAEEAAAAVAEAKAAKRATQKMDETYAKARAEATAKAAERKNKYSYPALHPPAQDPEAGRGEARAITREMEKNRGLTPHRSKEKKNPRKKHRLGFAKAQVRRKGQVQDVKTPSSSYGGEETGIKAMVAKSRRL